MHADPYCPEPASGPAANDLSAEIGSDGDESPDADRQLCTFQVQKHPAGQRYRWRLVRGGDVLLESKGDFGTMAKIERSIRRVKKLFRTGRLLVVAATPGMVAQGSPPYVVTTPAGDLLTPAPR